MPGEQKGSDMRGTRGRQHMEEMMRLVRRLEDERRDRVGALPLFVNPAQFHRILRRREARARMLGTQAGTAQRIAAVCDVFLSKEERESKKNSLVHIDSFTGINAGHAPAAAAEVQVRDASPCCSQTPT